jgi:hypothetical protein
MSGKQSGLGMRLLVGGYDISGDINAIDTVSGGPALIDSTDITQSAHSRIYGLRDGKLGFTAFMDASNAHPVLSALPTGDTLMTVLMPSTTATQAIGNAAACLNAKQVNYDPTRSNTGDLKLKVDGEGNSFGLEWCEQLTAGLRTDTGATNGATLDDGAASYWGAQIYLQVTAITGTSVTVTVQQSADNFSTSTTLGSAFTAVSAAPATQRVTTAAAQTFTATNASPCVFTVPGSAYADGVPVALSGSSLPTGFSASTVYYVVSSSGSTFELSATSGGTAINSSSTGSGTVTPAVLRYLRVVTTGTFNPATFSVVVNRNQASTVF